jgi:hypothetical protein
MKKLLDESADDLTRALLEAGRFHRPPAKNQAQLLVAMGIGAGVGLFSSKAFAWLGTSTGKLSVLGVGLGIAGAVYTALPEAPPHSGSPSGARASLEAAAPSVSERALLPAAVPAPAGAPVAPALAANPAALNPAALNPTNVPALVADAPSEARTDSASSSRVANGTPRRENAPAAGELPRRASKPRKSTAARRDDVVEPLERLAEGPQPAAPAPPPAVGVPAEPEPALAHVSGLDSEIRLVDAMRGAAQRNDAPELRRLVDSYRGAFPEGQLRQEVSELALRALPKPIN